jgi:hypothetical protein
LRRLSCPGGTKLKNAMPFLGPLQTVEHPGDLF